MVGLQRCKKYFRENTHRYIKCLCAAERVSIPPHKAALIMCKAFYIKPLLKRLEDITQAI